MAQQISAHSGATTVSASARSNAHLFVEKAAVSPYKVKINGSETANFTISKNDVSDAVSKITALATETGVSAKAVIVSDAAGNSHHRVLLIDETGDDIRIQNMTNVTSATNAQKISNAIETTRTSTPLTASPSTRRTAPSPPPAPTAPSTFGTRTRASG